MRIAELKRLQNKDPLEVVLILKSDESGFELLLNQSDLGRSTITIVLDILDLACTCHSKENLAETLKMVSNVDIFMVQLKKFITGIRRPMHKNDAISLEQLVTFLETLYLVNTTNYVHIIKYFLPHLKSDFESHMNEHRRLARRIDSLSLNVGCIQQVIEKSFREISVYPDYDDFDKVPFLRPNLSKGSYMNVESYLDTQFCLFREDYVRPLRESIKSYQRQISEGVTSRFQDIRVYRNVRLSQVLLTIKDGVIHKINFTCDKFVDWESSKRLAFGSLLCISLDNFQSILLATVVESNPSILRRGVVYIRFSEEHVIEVSRLLNKVFVAIEADAYFEAYRHVLPVLQEFTTNTFPLKEYIVDVRKDIKKPTYLENQELYCLKELLNVTTVDNLTNSLQKLCDSRLKDVKCLCKNSKERVTFPVSNLGLWPDHQSLGLDKTQLAAFKSALTQKLSLIQGPPGTGKTYVGLKIVQALLHNKHYQTSSNPCNPIFVVCYTNHALDQFLEGILKVSKKIVRVGGRSASEVLQKYNLKSLKSDRSDFTGSYRLPVKESLENFIQRIETLQMLRKASESRLLSENELGGSIPKDHLLSLLNGHPEYMSLTAHCSGEFILYWLRSKIPPHFYYEVDGYLYLWPDENIEDTAPILEDMHYSEFLSKMYSYPHMNTDSEEQYASPLPSFDEPTSTEGSTPVGLSRKSDLGKAVKLDYLTVQCMEEVNISNDTKPVHGGKKQTSKTKLHNFVSKHLQCEPLKDHELTGCQNIWDLRLPERWRLYKSWLLRFYVQNESNIKHEIHAYNETLKLYNELTQERDRLIIARYDVIGMTTTGAAKYKHLMRGLKPRVVIVEEAAEVLEAHVISSLSEHTRHVILIGDHQQLRPNPTCYELSKNYGLDVSLFERLINNGLPFCRLELQHRMRPFISQLLVPHIYESLEDHSSVFEYKDVLGMEQNVFFLSHSFREKQVNTSKSNVFEAEFLIMLCKYLVLQGYDPKQITILTTYLAQFALINQLSKKVHLLKEVKVTVVDSYQGEENDIILVSFVRSNESGTIGFLKTENRVCVALSRAKMGLYCVGDFDLLSKQSNLWEKIVQKLRLGKAIGTTLKTVCRNHGTEFFITKASEFDAMPDGGCSLPCGFLLKCGHTCKLKCHPVDPEHEDYKCTFPCTMANPNCEMGHNCTRLCWEECGPCKIKVNKVRSCLHETCLPCSVNPEEYPCLLPCQEIFPCGHKCPSKCGEPCPSCSFSVTVLSPCGHNVTVPCNTSDYEYALLSACKEACTKVLECGHNCATTCGSICTSKCLKTQDRLLSCGHVCKIPCYRGKEDEKQLLKICSVACNTLLVCGHVCQGTCGSCVQKRLHVICKQQCEKQLLCGHIIRKIQCFKAVPSCRQICRNECSHRSCIIPCSYIRFSCTSPCSWACEHYRCSRKCNEQCDRPVCDMACSKLLPCGHSCLGFCGELCPPTCLICNGKIVRLGLEETYLGMVKTESGKLILLESCGHVFDWRELEIWLNSQTETENNSFRKIWVPTCPQCKVPIRCAGRLGVLVRTSMLFVQQVNLKMYGDSFVNDLYCRTLLKGFDSLDLQLLYKGEYNRARNERLLNKLKQPLSNKKPPMHVLDRAYNYLRLCEELSVMILTVQKRDCISTSTRQIVLEISDFIVNKLDGNFQYLNSQLYYDTKKEIERIWKLIENETTESPSTSTCVQTFPEDISARPGVEGVLANSRKDLRFRQIQDFLIGNWYSCSNGHVCCISHAVCKNDFVCVQCQ